eukprot:TRINITY_DN81961_c0_g1_i1.p1 TRINITY_DN81961_c0_g1~~TRINITY_DN81961_c0_g1_i1.p1  ORF type:complete len:288 (-),score=55.41 TRINITY_DN81961_c0_g1_i1:519-1382(-)
MTQQPVRRRASLLAAIAQGAASVGSCPGSEWTAIGNAGKCYAVLEFGTQYSCEAKVCKPRGASLACLDSQETDAALRKMALARIVDYYDLWIGMFIRGDHATGTASRWITGCTSSYMDSLQGSHHNRRMHAGAEHTSADMCEHDESGNLTVTTLNLQGGWGCSWRCEYKPCLCEWPAASTEEYKQFRAQHRPSYKPGYLDYPRWCHADEGIDTGLVERPMSREVVATVIGTVGVCGLLLVCGILRSMVASAAAGKVLAGSDAPAADVFGQAAAECEEEEVEPLKPGT